jgi:hypothetical protein
MAFEIPGHKLGALLAGEDLSAKQYHFVKVNSSGKIVACSSQGERALGILQNKPLENEPAEVDRTGVSKLEMGGSATAVVGGDLITTDSAGKGMEAESGDYVAGVILETVSAGSVGSIALTHDGVL